MFSQVQLRGVIGEECFKNVDIPPDTSRLLRKLRTYVEECFLRRYALNANLAFGTQCSVSSVNDLPLPASLEELQTFMMQSVCDFLDQHRRPSSK